MQTTARMKFALLANIVLAIVLAEILLADDSLKNAQIAIGVINDTHAFDGAGCYIQLPDDYRRHTSQYIFVSDYGRKALVNLSGRDVPLVWLSGTEAKVEHKGDRSRFRFAGNGVKVSVEYTVIQVCAPKDEKCEVTAYDAILTVNKGGLKAKLAAKAECGS